MYTLAIAHWFPYSRRTSHGGWQQGSCCPLLFAPLRDCGPRCAMQRREDVSPLTAAQIGIVLVRDREPLRLWVANAFTAIKLLISVVVDVARW